ncbi:alpha/beta fold hydrolase [Nonlabens marinus]|uniref:Non-heme chloroperoxidase n=1 Tax=Nonlabens marinus S1-08 TaxID=1454201 RepID=W8VRS7_9FLAO|nr:alpha/beta hydrolase [Nonlabens marinus]BAO56459.1 non-heme chloroperoxidase [Nonlabens marinus S1-08]
MPYLEKTTANNESNISIYYEDYGMGKPIILIHGWPLSGDMWEYQVPALIEAGHRVITYDRRGFGKSSRPYDGYTYESMAEDLHSLIKKLSLENVTLVGFSMGGGELGKYVEMFGTHHISNLIFISSIAPYMLKTDDNKEGVPEEVFEDMKANVSKDRAGFLKGFGKDFVNYKDHKDKVSQGMLDHSFSIAVSASPKGTLDCIDAFGKTDLRDAMKKIDVPTLFIHGDADQIVPPAPTSKQGHELVKDSKLHMFKDAPHGLFLTHTEELNKAIIDFLK